MEYTTNLQLRLPSYTDVIDIEDLNENTRVIDEYLHDSMGKSVYDTNGSGVVDNAEKLGGQLPSYYGTAAAVTQAQNTADRAMETADEVAAEVLGKMYKPELVVTAPAGSTVEATDGETTLTSDTSTCTFALPNYGTWTVKASNGEDETSRSIEVDAVMQYPVTLEFAVIMGVQRDITSSLPAWERTDEAVGLSATATVGTAPGASDFDNMPIYRDIAKETVPSGDIMVKIPAFYYQRYRDGNTEHIRIADKPVDGFTLHPAFDRGDYGVYDHIYVGAYKTSSGHKSGAGVAPLVNITRAAFRSNAKTKGAGWGIIDLAAVSAIQMLITVEFATNDVQTAIGAGYSNASAALATGTCDTVTNLTGRPAGTADKVDVVWRGIEGFWGNVWEWTDGININNGTYYVSNNPDNYADDTASFYTALSYTGSTGWSSSYIQTEGLDEANSWAMMPALAGSGSATTYFCDGCWSSTGWRVFVRGGAWDDGSLGGLWASYTNIASSATNTSSGSRLLYLPR